MGLDMYGRAYQKRANGKIDNDIDAEELAYWRKHNALHAWMEDHFKQLSYDDYLRISGFTTEDITPMDFLAMQQTDFNCINVPLDEAALDKLEKAINDGTLVPRGGFFFGPTDYDPAKEADEDLEFVKKAREAIAAGKVVAYDSWW